MTLINKSGEEVWIRDKFELKYGDTLMLLTQLFKPSEYTDRVVFENEVFIINLLRTGEIIIYEK